MATDTNPEFGILSIPCLGFHPWQTHLMEEFPRHTLAKNVRALMAGSARLNTIKKLSDASGVSKGVVERMTKAEANTGVDHLQGIAKAFGLESWQLLRPELSADTGAVAASFSQDVSVRLRSATPEEVTKIEGVLRVLLSIPEAPVKTPSPHSNNPHKTGALSKLIDHEGEANGHDYDDDGREKQTPRRRA